MKISQHTVKDVFDFSSVGLHLYLTFIWKKKNKEYRSWQVSSHQTSSDIMPVATALKRLLRFSGFRCCRSTEETLCSVAGLKCMERLKSKIGWGIQAGCRRIWRCFSQKRKNNDCERHWRSCFWSLCSSGCSSPSGKSAITFLTYRMWNERASCPSVHFLLLIRDPPPPGGRIDKICYPFSVFWACLQGLWPDRCAWNLSGGSWVRGGSPGGISIRFPDTTSRSSGCTPRSLCLRTLGETLFLLLCIRCLVLWATSFYTGWRICWDGYLFI